MFEKESRSRKFLQETLAAGTFTGVAGAMAAGIATASLPVVALPLIASFGLYGACAGLMTYAGFRTGFSAMESAMKSNSNLKVLAGMASTIVGALGLSILAIPVPLESARAFKTPLEQTLTKTANASFGADWKQAKIGQTLNLTVPLDKTNFVPVTATVTDNFQTLYANMPSHPPHARPSPGPVRIETCVSFNAATSTAVRKPFNGPAKICEDRSLTQAEIGRMAP